MEQTLSKGEINKHIEVLRAAKRYSEEIITLVKEDLEYGLSQEKTELYLKTSYNIGQMRVLSECLRNGIAAEFVSLLENNELTGPQMQVALEFYQKGVPIGSIEEVVAKKEMPIAMRSAFNKVQEQLQTVKEETKTEPEYVKELVAKMEEIVSRICFQEKKYDALNEKLTLFESTKADEQIRDNLVKENEDKEQLLNDQQDKLNQANSAISRLRNQLEFKDKEIKRMSDRFETLEDKLLHSSSVGETPQLKKEDENNVTNETKKADNNVTNQPIIAEQIDIPIFYQVQVVDMKGRVIQKVQIDRTNHKTNGVIGLLSKLCFKKKSRSDIVKLVASGDLAPAQLIQIKSGIEKGLTEGQLVELINNNVAAEKMKEIIEIAVLENSMAY
jgi:predicted nuclease with TOPRIM domain